MVDLQADLQADRTVVHQLSKARLGINPSLPPRPGPPLSGASPPVAQFGLPTVRAPVRGTRSARQLPSVRSTGCDIAGSPDIREAARGPTASGRHPWTGGSSRRNPGRAPAT